MKMVKRLKPGQLCTINKCVYRCTKAADEKLDKCLQVVISCRKCEAVNGHCLERKFGYLCYHLFGRNCYPKPI